MLIFAAQLNSNEKGTGSSGKFSDSRAVRDCNPVCSRHNSLS